MRRIEHGEVDLEPEFQRRARLWRPHKKSQLIESLLLRIPLPVFYVAADVDDSWAVVDGLQRLTTIYDFIKNEYPLVGLEYLDALKGLYFSDLDRGMKRRIEETELIINVIQPGTPEEVMMNIFKRINTGGMPLSNQEIRNALHKGQVRDFLKKLADSEDFKESTDYSIKNNRMEAQEMALRFIAFFENGWNNYRLNDLDSFLNSAMDHINGVSKLKLTEIEAEFKRALSISKRVFGENAFRKINSSDRRSPISKPLFEAWTVNFARIDDEFANTVIKRKSRVNKHFAWHLENDSDFAVAISYSTGVPKRVYHRFDVVAHIIDQVASGEAPTLLEGEND